MICTNNIKYHNSKNAYYIIPESIQEFFILENHLDNIKGENLMHYKCYINFNNELTPAVKFSYEDDFYFFVFIGFLQEKCNVKWK